MKKIVAALLCIALLVFAAQSAVCANADRKSETGFKAFVATDIHHAVSETVPQIDGEYQYYDNLGLTPTLAPALLSEFLKQAAAGDEDYVFLTGDIADVPEIAQAKAVAKKLALFEKQTGKQVFVINGNHDTVYTDPIEKTSTTYQAFKKIYARFGYNEALCVDKQSCSYTADLKNGYRLIAIDALDRPGEGGATITPHLANWIRAQAADAKKSGVKLVALMHHPLMNHFTLMNKLLPIFVVSNSKEACKLFAQCGIQYVFTGHFHQNDIAVYHGERDVYDIETTSLSCYPNAYRTVAFRDNAVEIQTVAINNIHTFALPNGYTKEQKALIERDLSAYTYSCLKADSIKQVHAHLDAARLMQMLGTSDPNIKKMLDGLLTALSEGFYLPLYGEGKTIAAYAKEAGLSLPESEYQTLNDAAAAFIAAQLSGDEDFDTDSPLFRVVLIGVFSILQHQIKQAAQPVLNLRFQKALLRTAAMLFEKTGLSNAASRCRAAIKNRINADAVQSLLLKPLTRLLIGLTIDKEPADNNVELPGYTS